MGGPARQDAPKAVDALKKLNVPYMVSLPLVFQTTEEWMASELGVHPVQVALQVRLSLDMETLTSSMLYHGQLLSTLFAVIQLATLSHTLKPHANEAASCVPQ